MPTLAVKILDPAGQHWAQLLEATEPVRRLLPVLVERLALPEEPNYELVEQAADRVLPPTDSLAEAGIRGGEELLIRPVRDDLLAAFLDALYDEALGFVAGKAFEAALARLETLYRLEPGYPDREGLWPKVVRGTGASASGGAAPRLSSTPPRSGSGGGGTSGSAAGGSRGSGSGSGSSGGGGCLIRLVAFVVVAGVGVWLSGAFDRVDWSTWPPTIRSDTASTTVVDGVTVGTGDVRVTLQWDSPADVDLHVTDPTGEEIYFGNPDADSGGELDVDANAGCTDDPRVENVFWPRGAAPNGTFVVEVVLYSACSTTRPTAYTVTAEVDGRQVQQQRGTLAPDTPRVEAFRFTR